MATICESYLPTEKRPFNTRARISLGELAAPGLGTAQRSTQGKVSVAIRSLRSAVVLLLLRKQTRLGRTGVTVLQIVSSSVLGVRVRSNQTAGQSNSTRARVDLETVIRRLHHSRIRAGVHTFDKGIFVWISDRLHRIRRERVFKQSRENLAPTDDGAAVWLHEAALQMFPGSPYARDHSVGGDGRCDDEATAGMRDNEQGSDASRPA